MHHEYEDNLCIVSINNNNNDNDLTQEFYGFRESSDDIAVFLTLRPTRGSGPTQSVHQGSHILKGKREKMMRKRFGAPDRPNPFIRDVTF